MSIVDLNEKKAGSTLSNVVVDLSSFTAFLEHFPLQGESLYSAVFERNSSVIQTQKPRFAVANLEKILNATFEISAGSGFDRMSCLLYTSPSPRD